MSESKTPRVDAAEFTGQAEWAEDNAPLLGCVTADFARQLETELQQAREELEKAKEVSDNNLRLAQKLQSRLTTLEKLAGELAGNLHNVKEACKANPAMNGRQYDLLGSQVLKALDAYSNYIAEQGMK